MYDSFYNFLVSKKYSEYTATGNKGTVYSYCRAIESVLKKEGITWETLTNRIDQTVKKYDRGGIYEEFGNKSHRTVINALKAFQLFCKS